MEARTVLAALTASATLGVAPALADDCEGRAAPGTHRIVVTAEGVRAAAGEVAFTVYPDDRRRFLAKGGKLLRARVPAAAPSTTACFWLPPAVYSVVVYHDANGNRDFDRKLTGMPAEGFALSNNPPTRFALPSFESTRVRLAGGAPLRVQMRYR